eukprot:gnl/Dysnectes_brevis/1875_a2155_906.p2 GENE.gnl/Dysnectes_brevis/1875_a2155_906~~gnl/Dysnectes_brevis/1875_a2155_906.p2  ORF type:complete len:264 (-),score=52.20 gnl/Dysnectes_brevis/1875_a2155_906:1019-1810(-)
MSFPPERLVRELMREFGPDLKRSDLVYLAKECQSEISLRELLSKRFIGPHAAGIGITGAQMAHTHPRRYPLRMRAPLVKPQTPYFHWSPDNSHPLAYIGPELRRASAPPYGHARGMPPFCVGLEPIERNTTLFSVRIGRSALGRIHIGVGVPDVGISGRESASCRMLGGLLTCKDLMTFTCCSGTARRDREEVRYGIPLREGGVLSVLVSRETDSLHYYIDGVDLGACHRSLPPVLVPFVQFEDGNDSVVFCENVVDTESSSK